MVQMDGDYGQKGMVHMANDIADTIIEPDKRECLMSLLECGVYMVRDDLLQTMGGA